MIIPYRGYGTTQKIYVKGHVLDDRLLYESHHKDKRRKNIRAMLSRYMSSSLPDISVEVHFNDARTIVTTDENGLFEATLELSKPAEPGWHNISYYVLDEIVENQEPLEEKGQVFINDQQSDFAVVSDVDDTILISHATQALRKLRLILTKNSKTRLPFTGVAAFYQALVAQHDNNIQKPIFYVSSSEWNLYDFLEDFCDVRKIPKGCFMLQELKTSLWKLLQSGGGTHQHKKDKVLHLLDVFPQQKFILIGDSGQHDASLYKSIVQERPGRILAIYIRDVGKSSHARKVNKIAETMGNEVEMVLVEDSNEAAQHAYEKGFISKEGKKRVAQEFVEQLAKPKSLVEQVVEEKND
ncbi:MAG: phosphatase domain-containing protein [Fulvivirga sp.]|nr:phosphatase domain-containing protein [Fulvivirga sp.]